MTINSPKHINIILALFSRLQTLGDLLDYNGDWQDANVLVLVSINHSLQLSTHHTYHSLLITSFLYFSYFCWKQHNNNRQLNIRYSPFLHVYIFLQKCHIYQISNIYHLNIRLQISSVHFVQSNFSKKANLVYDEITFTIK